MRGLETLLCLALGLAPWWKGAPAIGAAAVALLWAAGRLRPWRPPPGTGWLAALLVWRAASALWSEEPARTLAKSLKTAYLLPYVALAGAAVPIDRARPVRWLLGSTAAVCALGLLEPRRQYEGFFAHHNQMGALAAFVGVLALSPPGGRAAGPARWAAPAAAVLGPLGVALARSRSALVGLGAAYLAWGAQRGRRGVVAALLLLALAGGAAVSIAPRVEVPLGGSLHIRYLNWKAATSIVRERPLLGVGYDSLGTFYDRRLKPHVEIEVTGPPSLGHAHNEYLTVAAETGAVGLALYLGLMTSILRALVAAGAPAAATALFALLAADVFERNLAVEAVVLPVALTLGLVRRPSASPG